MCPQRPSTSIDLRSCRIAGEPSPPHGLDWKVETFNLELSYLKRIKQVTVGFKGKFLTEFTTWQACIVGLMTKVSSETIGVIQKEVLEWMS